MNEFLFWLLSLVISIEAASAQASRPLPEITIPHPPDVVMIDGKPTVYYEIHLLNVAGDSVELLKLDVFDAVDSSVLVSIPTEELKKIYSRVGVFKADKKNILSPGAASVVYLEYALPNDKPNVRPVHHLTFETSDSYGKKFRSVRIIPLTFTQKAPLILGAPLRTGPWIGIYEPTWERGHRRVLYTVNGKARIPGRFAVDFIRLDPQGRYAQGDNDSVKNWYGYGNDVLAVADGVVAATLDSFRESPTLSQHPKYSAEQATGNYISMHIGANQVVFYEHLKPGSLRVKPGQWVKKGDVIASVGFTGQTTGPHLHLHVADADSPLGAEGVPFVFEQFTLLGSYTDFGNFGKLPWSSPTDAGRTSVVRERPAPNSVIQF